MNCAKSSLHTTGMQQPVQSSTSCNCGSSAVSSTLSMHCNWRISMVNGPREPASAPRQGCQRPCPSTNTTVATVGARLSRHRHRYGFLTSQDQGRQPLRHDSVADDLDTRTVHLALRNNGHVKNRSKSSTWRISTVICTQNRTVQPLSRN